MNYDFDKITERKGNGAIKWHESGKTDVLEMGTADMDFESAPEIVEAFIERAKIGDFGYFQKSANYYDAIINWNLQRYGWQLTPEQINCCPGVIAGIGMCICALSKPGDAVLMDAPYFGPIAATIEDNDRKMISVPMKKFDDCWKIDFDLFEEILIREQVKIYVLVNPHNPTGKVYARAELEKIAEICENHGVYVISDEVHGNIIYDGSLVPYTSVAEAAKRHGIVVTSVTKGFNLQGLCYGLVIIENPELMERYKVELHRFDFDYSSNVFSTTAVEAAYTGGSKWLQSVTGYLKKNRDYAMSYIQKELPSIKVIAPQASYLLWLDCRSMNMDEDALKTFFLDKCKVGLNYGSKFGTEGAGYVRLNFACPMSILREALERIKTNLLP